MVRHIILWKLKDSLQGAEKQAAMEKAKSELEALNGKIDGLLSLHVTITQPLPSSNADMLLESTFTTVEALDAYQIHPLHMAAATTYVRPLVETRLCLDVKE